LRAHNKIIVFVVAAIITIEMFIFSGMVKDKQGPQLERYEIDLPLLDISNADNGLDKWMIPAIMLGEGLESDFIRENVYIHDFSLVSADPVIQLSFSISYSEHQSVIARSYQMREFGTVFTVHKDVKKTVEPLISVSDFFDLFRIVEHKQMMKHFRLNDEPSHSFINSISRLGEADLDPDTTVVYRNNIVPLENIDPRGEYAVCFVTFAARSGGSQIPFVVQL
jgi:hypothetical protein